MGAVRGSIFHVLAGTAVLFSSTAAFASSSAVLFDFEGTPGCWPRSLMKASDGNYYGMVSSYRAGLERSRLFSMTEDGAGQVGNELAAPPIVEGYGLTETPDGFLWGIEGNSIFKMSRSGQHTTVHTFTGGSDGQTPSGGLTLGDDGWLYGTTTGGGQYQQGTAYRLSLAGSVETIASFNCFINGCSTVYPLTKGSDGAMYGVSTSGGDIGSTVNYGQGVIFRVTPARGIEVLHQFINPGNQSEPSANASAPRKRLLEVKGYLYGTATGGARHGRGEFFRMKLDGSDYQPFYYPGAGVGPVYAAGGFTRLRNGDIVNWGGWSTGTVQVPAVWKLGKRGAPQLIHALSTPPYLEPTGELVEASDGSLLGVNAIGPAQACGNIEKVVP